MNVYYGLSQLPTFTNPVITIGTFDGVHRGHARIIHRLNERARQIGGESVIITFDPHPRLVLSKQTTPIQLLTTLDEKIVALGALAVDHLVVVPFTQAFADLSAQDYIEQFLVHHFHPHTFIIGYDHHFGKNRTGNYQLLELVKEQYGFVLEEIPMQVLEHAAISSTRIRESLQQGDIRKANDYLGKPYSLLGRVIEGEQRGRTIGFPTANLHVDEHKLIPANGVYAVNALLNAKSYKGMMNIGVRPTLAEGLSKSIEVHMFDFNEAIYAQELRVDFMTRLRDEKKFDNLSELRMQLELDRSNALAILTD